MRGDLLAWSACHSIHAAASSRAPRRAPSTPRTANFTVREGARHDLGAMADNLEAGFASYRSWADARWEPPSRVEMLLGMMQRFQHDGSWSFVGFADNEPAGHVRPAPEVDEHERRCPASRRSRTSSCAATTGAAGSPTCSTRGCSTSMLERGYTSAVLWTPPAPAGRARSTRATLAADGRDRGADNGLGLELMEYALELPAAEAG